MKTKKLKYIPKQDKLSHIFNKVPEKLLEGYDDLSLSSKMLLCVIYNGAALNDTKHDRETGTCGFSNEILQRKTGLSERTVSTSLKQLEEYGIIKRKKDASGNRRIKVLVNLLDEQPWETEAVEAYKQARKKQLQDLMEESPSTCSLEENDDEDAFDY
ncbi:MAG: helix-turn-helix domain-containing protein [Oscillibacter sp.]|nr:helix-turn-helix domain-containing protein [Oscillibacter sp.]